jgi:hypothetical protein
MDRLDLVPAAQRAERLFLLDLLAGRERDFDGDAEAFLAVAPSKLHPFLHVRLRDRALPPALRETLSAAHRRNAMKELRRAAELRRIDAALGAAGIPSLVLKGPVLAATVYPDRASRTMTDLDFLLHERDLSRATAVLGEVGYRMPPQFAGAELAAGDAPPLIHDQPGGPSIELHTMLDSLPDDREALAAMLPTARRVAVGHGLELRTLDRGEFFAHVVLHVSKHHRFEGELRSLLDVALLLHAERDLDWSALGAAWERRGILEWIVLTVALAHLLLDAPVPAALAAHPASEEALALAAEQLWIVEKGTVPPRLTFVAAGTEFSPVHAGVPAHHAPVPAGMAGARARVARGLELLRRVTTSGVRGGLAPRVFSREVELFRRRERLFAMVEKPSARDCRAHVRLDEPHHVRQRLEVAAAAQAAHHAAARQRGAVQQVLPRRAGLVEPLRLVRAADQREHGLARRELERLLGRTVLEEIAALQRHGMAMKVVQLQRALRARRVQQRQRFRILAEPVRRVGPQLHPRESRQHQRFRSGGIDDGDVVGHERMPGARESRGQGRLAAARRPGEGDGAAVHDHAAGVQHELSALRQDHAEERADDAQAQRALVRAVHRIDHDLASAAHAEAAAVRDPAAHVVRRRHDAPTPLGGTLHLHRADGHLDVRRAIAGRQLDEGNLGGDGERKRPVQRAGTGHEVRVEL